MFYTQFHRSQFLLCGNGRAYLFKQFCIPTRLDNPTICSFIYSVVKNLKNILGDKQLLKNLTDTPLKQIMNWLNI